MGNGVGGNGGSGGGGYLTAGTGNAGSYSPAEGTNGQLANGGRGGGSTSAGASGGAGTSNSITGSAVTYAAGATGGNDPVTAGTANTGNGGQGAYANIGSELNGAAGGSGVVIIAYPNTYPALTSIGGGLTYNEPTRSGYRVYRFTAGTGTVTV
jgi:hypothetical protein